MAESSTLLLSIVANDKASEAISKIKEALMQGKEKFSEFKDSASEAGITADHVGSQIGSAMDPAAAGIDRLNIAEKNLADAQTRLAASERELTDANKSMAAGDADAAAKQAAATESYAKAEADVSSASGGVVAAHQDVENAARGAASETENLGEKQGFLASASGKVAVAGGIAVAAFGELAKSTVEAAEKYQASTTQMAAAGGMSVKQATAISNAFLKTAGDSTFTGQQMTTAFGSVAGPLAAMQGHVLSASQALGFESAAANVAEARHIDLGTATTSLMTVMQAYGMKVGDAGKASDILSSTAQDTGQSVDTLATMIQRLHGRLGVASPSLQDMGGLLADLTAHGIAGRTAMSMLNTSVASLIAPTAAGAKAMAFLGLNMTNANGAFIGIGPAIGELHDKLQGMNQQQQLAALRAMGMGTQASALLPIIESGASSFDKYSTAVGKTGAAHEAAEKASSSYEGQTEKMKAALADTKVVIGQALLPAITSLMHTILAILKPVMSFVEGHKKLVGIMLISVTAIAAVTTAILLAKKAFGAMGTAVDALKSVGSIFSGMAAKFTGATTTMEADAGKVVVADEGMATAAEASGEASSMAMGPIGIALMAVIGVIMLLVTHWKEVEKVAEEVWNAILSAVKAVWNWISKNWPYLLAIITGPYGLAVVFIIEHFKQIEDIAKTVIDKITGFFTGLWKSIKSIITGLWKDIKSAFAKGVEDVINIVTKVLTWYVEFPVKVMSAIAGLIGSIGSFFSGIVSSVISTLGGWLDWFVALPGKLISDIASLPGKFAAEAGKWVMSILDSFAGIGGKIMSKITSGLGNIAGHIGSIIGLAEGGIVTKPTLAVIGEAGPEVVVPLTGGMKAGIANTATPLSPLSSPNAGTSAGAGTMIHVSFDGAQFIAPGGMNQLAQMIGTKLVAGLPAGVTIKH